MSKPEQPVETATPTGRPPHPIDLLHDRTTQSGVALFAAYGIALSPVGADEEKRALEQIAFLSIAGVAGPALSGVVVLGITEDTLRRSNRTSSSHGDWMGELGNQLVGRLKNGLLREGIAIHRTPPAVVQGGAPALPHQRPNMRSVALRSGEDAVFIWTDAETSLSDARTSPPDEAGEVLAEGEMLLF